MPRKVVVVGAGVVGLSCAHALAEAGHSVVVVADWFPRDPRRAITASPWAGAHFRPFPTDETTKKLTRDTLRVFEQFAQQHPESSVRFVEGIDYIEDPTPEYQRLEGYEGISHLRVLSPDELPKGTTFGCIYSTWVLDPLVYLDFLARRLQFRYGVELHRKRLSSLAELTALYPGCTIVNATGRGLQADGGYDPTSFTRRGQTLLVHGPPSNTYSNQTITHQARNGEWTFLIPRPLDGGFIVGGTKQDNDEDSDIRPSDTEAVVSRAKVLFPDLLINGSLDIRGINVGFRPMRDGGFRLEKDQIGSSLVVHAYGAGGMGYELSYGVALAVCELVTKHSKL